MRSRLGALAALALAAACGTTVPVSQGTGPVTSTTGDGVVAPTGTTALPSYPSSSSGGGSTSGTTSGATSGTTSSTTGSSPSTSTPVETSASVPTGPKATLKIGTYYFDETQTNSVITAGGGNSAVGDMRAEQKAVATWINGHGGVGGHPISLVPHRVDIQGNPNTEAQALCSAWTDDAKVYAGLGSLPTTNPGLVSCLVKHKTLAIGGSSSNVETSAAFAKWAPYYYAPAAFEMITVGRIYAQGLINKGFMTPGAKVGVLYVDDPDHAAAFNAGVMPTLKRAGITPIVTTGVSYDGSYTGYAGLVSQAQSAAVRFHSRGVTHVLLVDTGGALATWFMQQAQSQNWAPHYGLSTLSAPSFLETNVNKRQLANVTTVGWRPADDLSSESRFPANAARQQCDAIMKAAHLKPVSAFDLSFQLTICADFFFLKTVLDKSPSLSAADFQKTVAGLGTTNAPSASGFLDRYAAGKSWGGYGYATGSFVASCGCFQYDGKPHTL